jgi:amidase
LTGDKEYPISGIDAVVVARILEAGGTIVGTATCEHFSMSPMSYTSASGAVHNPWKKGWTAGGSSSGPGVLVGISQIRDWRKRHRLPELPAEELGEGVDMAIGGDQGGSIRIPAAYCGIYGLKPTHGLVPYTGILSLNPMIDHTGPMAKTLEDTASLLSVIAGYDGFDPRMTPESPRRTEVKDYLGILSTWVKEKQDVGEWTPSSAGKGLRIGVIKESFEVLGLSDSVKSIVKIAIDRFEDLGAEVKEISIPMHLIGPSIWTTATRIGIATAGFQNHPFHLLNHPIPGISPPPLNQKSYEILTKHNPAAVNVIFNSTFLQHNRHPSLQAKAMMHVHELRAAYDEALKDVDVLVTPLNPKVGIPHPELEWSVGDKMKSSIGGTLNMCQFNVAGHPALAMPVGFGDLDDGKGKMPVAMQLVARRWEDEMCFKVAKAWEVGGLGLDSWDGR